MSSQAPASSSSSSAKMLSDEASALTAPSRAKLAARPHRAAPTSSVAGTPRKTRWSAREEQRKRQEATKTKERAMRQAKEDEASLKREARQERQRKKEEKERLDIMAQKMSRKKLDRKRRRLGLTKKVAH